MADRDNFIYIIYFTLLFYNNYIYDYYYYLSCCHAPTQTLQKHST